MRAMLRSIRFRRPGQKPPGDTKSATVRQPPNPPYRGSLATLPLHAVLVRLNKAASARFEQAGVAGLP
jgi:hypothetical protein